MADNQGNSGNTASILVVGIVLVLAVLVGGFFMMQSANSTVDKNNAITGAANAVSDTAHKAGNAVDKNDNSNN